MNTAQKKLIFRKVFVTLACASTTLFTACEKLPLWRTYSAAGLEAFANGEVAKAEHFLTAAVKDAERHGSDDFRVAVTLNILAGYYRTLERYEEAEPLYKRALSVAESRWSPNHPRIAHVLENYSLLLSQTGRVNEAALMAGRAAAIRRSQPN
tara:strand:+ start:831 stop:1289 length:459 start_codon:yes stop_codon:yes gene_type:complete